METLRVFEYDWQIEVDEVSGWEVASCQELKVAATGGERKTLLENIKDILKNYDISVPPGNQVFLNNAETLPGLYVLRQLELIGIPTKEAEDMVRKMGAENEGGE